MSSSQVRGSTMSASSGASPGSALEKPGKASSRAAGEAA
jgi:hypothetical protein